MLGVPLLGLLLFVIGDKVASELVVSLRVRDVILVSALAVPALLSIFIARWGGPTSWFMAVAVGIFSGPIALVLTFIPLIVICSVGSDCD